MKSSALSIPRSWHLSLRSFHSVAKFWSSVESEFPLRAEALQRGDYGYCQSGTFGQAGKRSLLSSVSCGCSSDKELMTSRDSPLVLSDKDNLGSGHPRGSDQMFLSVLQSKGFLQFL